MNDRFQPDTSLGWNGIYPRQNNIATDVTHLHNAENGEKNES